MRVICLLLQNGPPSSPERRQSLAEACLAFSPQVALGSDAVFLEVEASRQLFTPEECIQRLRKMLQTMDIPACIAMATDLPSALAFARYGISERALLPVEALGNYLNPFAPAPWPKAPLLRQLGIETLGELEKIPRSELAARFGKEALFALSRLHEAERLPWPRFTPEEKLEERVDFDCAAQIHAFEPVLFLLKTAVDRLFLRLFARRLKLAACEVKFHLNRFSGAGRERIQELALPLPQSDPKGVLALLDERLRKELELRPLADALEGLTLSATETAPFPDTQRDFFTKAEEEREAWASLVGRLRERLGESSSFLAVPAPRLLPEASWRKSLEKDSGTLVDTPLRPLRILSPPQPLRRLGPRLSSPHQHWKILAFEGPEKLQSEWWISHLDREYFRVETEEGPTLWVFSSPASPEPDAPRKLYLHGMFD